MTVADDMNFITYEEAINLIDSIGHAATDELVPAAVSSGLEQIGAVSRDHLAAAGCDPASGDQLRACLIGALLTVTLQAQVTPTAVSTVLLLMALRDAATRSGRNARVTPEEWEAVTRSLSLPAPAGRLTRLLRHLGLR